MRFLFLCPHAGRTSCDLLYASCVAEKYIAPLIAKYGHDVKVIQNPTPKQAETEIKLWKPDVVWWVGHGAPSTTSLTHVKIWISDCKECGGGWGTQYLEDLKGVKYANALSCLTARCLGLKLTKEYGCEWYKGYTNRFWFLWCGCPGKTGCACGSHELQGVRKQLLFDCMTCAPESDLYFVVGLALGMSPQEAAAYSKARFEQWVKYFDNLKPENNHEAALIKAAKIACMANASILALCHAGVYVQPVKPSRPLPPIHGVPSPPKKESAAVVLAAVPLLLLPAIFEVKK